MEMYSVIQIAIQISSNRKSEIKKSRRTRLSVLTPDNILLLLFRYSKNCYAEWRSNNSRQLVGCRLILIQTEWWTKVVVVSRVMSEINLEVNFFKVINNYVFGKNTRKY